MKPNFSCTIDSTMFTKEHQAFVVFHWEHSNVTHITGFSSREKASNFLSNMRHEGINADAVIIEDPRPFLDKKLTFQEWRSAVQIMSPQQYEDNYQYSGFLYDNGYVDDGTRGFEVYVYPGDLRIFHYWEDQQMFYLDLLTENLYTKYLPKAERKLYDYWKSEQQ